MGIFPIVDYPTIFFIVEFGWIMLNMDIKYAGQIEYIALHISVLRSC